MERRPTLNEERLQLALECGRMGTWDLDLRTGRVVWDARERALLGLDDHTASLESFYERVHPHDRAFMAGIAEALRAGPQDYEFRVLLPDGTVRWLAGRGRAVLDDEGRPERLVGVNFDITTRKEAEAARRLDDERLGLLQAALPVAFFTAAPVGSYGATWMSESVQRLTGFPTRAFVQDPELWAARLHPEERDEVLAAIAAHQREPGRTVRSEYRWRCADGSWRWFLDEAVLLPERDGVPAQLVGLWVDITQRKAAEEALLESRARLDLLLEALPVAVVTAAASPPYDATWISPSAERLTGFPAAAFLEPGFWASRLHPEDRARAFSTALDLVDPPRTLRMEYRWRCADDGYRRFLFEGGVRAMGDGPDQVVGVWIDVTERRAAEEALRAAEARVRESERLASLGILAAGVAHEINNPVGGILLAAEYGLEALARGDVEVALQSLHDVVEDARRCQHVVDSVLRLSGKRASEKRSADLREVARRALARVVPEASLHHAALEQDLDGPLPPALVNALDVEQVLVNLLTNAIRAGEGRPVRVRLELRREGRWARARVEDDGVGMSAEALAHLFDPFFTTRRDRGGTGLGLSIAHAIVREHGGCLAADSAPGRGTTFTLDLPLAVAAAEED